MQAETEIEELKEELKATNIELSDGRLLTRDIGMKVKEMESELSSAKSTNAKFMERNLLLETYLKEKDDQLEGLTETQSQMEQTLRDLQGNYDDQRQKLEKV